MFGPQPSQAWLAPFIQQNANGWRTKSVLPNPSFKGEAQRRGTLAIKRRGLRPHFALAVQRATPPGSPLTQTLGFTHAGIPHSAHKPTAHRKVKDKGGLRSKLVCSLKEGNAQLATARRCGQNLSVPMGCGRSTLRSRSVCWLAAAPTSGLLRTQCYGGKKGGPISFRMWWQSLRTIQHSVALWSPAPSSLNYSQREQRLVNP
jgi:hypothetical protein